MKATSEIVIPNEVLSAESERLAARNLRRSRLFVLLLGPSAVGKSTIISELNKQNGNSFVYVSPFMTRSNRPGETDKVSIDDGTFQQMEDAGEFVVVNNMYNVSYGTPLKGVLEPLAEGNTPILDYPLNNVSALKRPEYDLLGIYVYPPSIDSWRHRMESTGRNMNGRLETGAQELGSLALLGYDHPDIDLSIVNADGNTASAAAEIIRTLGTYTS